MIEIHVRNRLAGDINESNVLLALDATLDRTKFYGTILLTYEDGQLKAVKAQQNFTTQSLIDYLSK